MFKTIIKFVDLQDNNHIYNVGDIYPRKGYNPSKKRVLELASKNNKRGKILIEEISTAEKEKLKIKEDKIGESVSEKESKRKTKTTNK